MSDIILSISALTREQVVCGIYCNISCVIFPEPTRPADIPPTLPPRETDQLIYDKDQAWDYYQKFIKVSLLC